MLAGSAGSGKTTLALQYLVNGTTRYNDRGVYLTFEQLPDQIYRDALGFGWDPKKLEEEGRIELICTSPDLMLDADAGDGLLVKTIKELQPQVVVVRSVSGFRMLVLRHSLR